MDCHDHQFIDIRRDGEATSVRLSHKHHLDPFTWNSKDKEMTTF